MQKYIDQLIADIEDAKKNVPLPDNTIEVQNPANPLAYIEVWENEITPKMSELLGLEKVQFPPAEQLSEAQMQVIIQAMLDLWEVFNFYYEENEKLPLELYYTVIVNSLDEYYSFVAEEKTGIDFCSYNYELCQLGEYCHCLEFKEEWEKEEAKWENTTEEEKEALLADFNRRVGENLRNFLENESNFLNPDAE